MNKRLLVLFFVIALFFVPSARAAVKVNTIPPPTPIAKLRVIVYAFTQSDLRQTPRWSVTEAEFAAYQARILEKTGIFEVVSEGDVKAALGDQFFSFDQMERNDWGLARELGKGVHADYVMAVVRRQQKGMQGVDYLFNGVLINSETGKSYKSGFQISGSIMSDRKEAAERQKQTHRKIFNLAKEDMLAAAVKKRAAFVPTSSARPAIKPAPAASDHAEAGRSKDTKMVLVYDLDSNEQNRIVALILAEALREEVLTLKQFALVPPEDLQKVRESMVSQATESIDEKQAISMGKGIAADQVVTGRLGLEGDAFVVQAKRTEVETLTSPGRSSLTFRAGQEGEVMNKLLPAFARELMGLKK